MARLCGKGTGQLCPTQSLRLTSMKADDVDRVCTARNGSFVLLYFVIDGPVGGD